MREDGGHVERTRCGAAEQGSHRDDEGQGQQVPGQDPRRPPHEVAGERPLDVAAQCPPDEGGRQQVRGQGEEDRDAELAPHRQPTDDALGAGAGPEGDVREQHQPGRDGAQRVEPEDPSRSGLRAIHLVTYHAVIIAEIHSGRGLP
ncbi:hypothetical protein B277_12000 [Janibacter hoylei PVAS-1]|uniref:Uncharacterized protein n=1 Tax=Janibacter hoylei PVAS-1 TaxID=1210046 RepID=K1DWG0_9MICO|nr:hypothetical protein [Janibacter hoylei]EKA60694.1 hypothetical protein B277_12000 [Janibacter hoylei PVAS-1]